MNAPESENQKNAKNTKITKKPKIFAQSISPKTLFFFGGFSSRFCFFLSPIANESSRVQQPKKPEENKKQRNPKTKTFTWGKSLGATFLPRLCFFLFFGFLRSFLFFLSAVAAESFRVQKQKNRRKQKKQSYGGNLWAESFSQDFVFLFLLVFFEVPFCFLFSSVADESFRVQKPKNSKKTKKTLEIFGRKINRKIFFCCFLFSSSFYVFFSPPCSR